MSKMKLPSVEQQLAEAKAHPGSALEKLIRDNQDFSILPKAEIQRFQDGRDKIGLPLWLRVHFHKQHPELEFRANDPTGGYPGVLRNIYAWMVTHQDLQPEPPDDEVSDPPSDTQLQVDATPLISQHLEIGPNLRISGSRTSPRSESDIRVNYNNTRQIIAASNNVGPGGQAQFFSVDGGLTWGQSFLPRQTDLGDDFHSDPTVDWTSDGTAWAITLGVNAASGNSPLRAYGSNNGGVTWNFDSTISGDQAIPDKEMMWVDHSPTSPFRDNIYVIWDDADSGSVFVNRRTGPAGAWQTPIQVSRAETIGTGIGSDIKTNSFGDVFAFWPNTGNLDIPGSQRLFVAKSTDGGAHFAAPVTIATTFDSFTIGVPSSVFRPALIYISGGAFLSETKNLVYAIWTDLTGESGCNTEANESNTNISSPCKTRIWFSRSTNGGATWEAARMINNQSSLNDQFNPKLVLDEKDGRLVVIYYDTVDDPGRLKTDVWAQMSSNDGVTWSNPVKVTTAQTDETTAGADFGNQYGDYNGLSGIGGKYFASWTDRRSGGSEEIWTAAISVSDVPFHIDLGPAHVDTHLDVAHLDLGPVHVDRGHTDVGHLDLGPIHVDEGHSDETGSIVDRLEQLIVQMGEQFETREQRLSQVVEEQLLQVTNEATQIFQQYERRLGKLEKRLEEVETKLQTANRSRKRGKNER